MLPLSEVPERVLQTARRAVRTSSATACSGWICASRAIAAMLLEIIDNPWIRAISKTGRPRTSTSASARAFRQRLENRGRGASDDPPGTREGAPWRGPFIAGTGACHSNRKRDRSGR